MIASGYMRIKEAPVFKIQPEDEFYVPSEDEKELLNDPFLNTEAVIQSIKLDRSLIQSGQHVDIIYKEIEALEAIAWLYNCHRLQCDESLIPVDMSQTADFWLIKRRGSYYYSKNKETNLRKLPDNAKKMIKQANKESAEAVKIPQKMD